jgi:hypothetical protein
MSILEHVLCINLESSVIRRQHMDAEFSRIGILKYEFIKAFEADSPEVLELLESDLVHKHPPCFRCGRDRCDCDNKALFAPQIGNWLSHMAAWKKVRFAKGGLHLVCEDDLKFTEAFQPTVAWLDRSRLLRDKISNGEPVLVRLGWALCDEHNMRSEPRFTDEIRMSNPCYALNAEMAEFALNSLARIDTTSDVYLHQQIAPQSNHYTVMPPVAYELSWSTGQIRSEIRPKEKHIAFLRSQLSSCPQGTDRYEMIKQQLQDEERRLRDFESTYTTSVDRRAGDGASPSGNDK